MFNNGGSMNNKPDNASSPFPFGIPQPFGKAKSSQPEQPADKANLLPDSAQAFPNQNKQRAAAGSGQSENDTIRIKAAPKQLERASEPRIKESSRREDEKAALQKKSDHPAGTAKPAHSTFAADAQTAQQRQNSAAQLLPALLEDVSKGIYAHCRPTGFGTLDEKLSGGLHAGLYLFGGAAGSGKTAFAVSIADHIASLEEDVLYFALDTSAAELMLRSISRIVAQQNRGTGFTYTELLNAAAIQEKRTQNAINYYAQTIAPHLHIFEGSSSFGVQQIRELTASHIRSTGRAPVVIIDFLQILASNEPPADAKIRSDKTILELKRLSRDFHIPVISIAGFGSNNFSREITYNDFAGAETLANICDAVFALQLEGQGIHNTEAALSATPRSMQLVCLKYRFGPQGWRLPLRYYPAVNLYTDMMNDIPTIAKTNKLKKAVRAKLNPGLLPSKLADILEK